MASRPIASVARRLLAYAIDVAWLFLFVCIVQTALLMSGAHPFISDIRGGRMPPIGPLHLWVSASTTLPFLAYFAWSFSRRGGATLGQRMVRIRVAAVEGGSLPLRRSFLRAAVLLLPFELNHAVIFELAPWREGPANLFLAGIVGIWVLILVYLFMPLLRRDGRALHDLAAGSRVVPAAPVSRAGG